MRISDWSSDVCSSDLAWRPARRLNRRPAAPDSDHRAAQPPTQTSNPSNSEREPHNGKDHRHRPGHDQLVRGDHGRWQGQGHREQRGRPHHAVRSEEHTSELQSLMRNSYAVFCLKKKTKNNNKREITDTLRIQS